MAIQRNGVKYTSVGIAVETASSGNVSDGALLIGQGGVSQNDAGVVSVDTSSISWKVLLRPATFSVGMQDVDLDAGRTSAGWMKRNKKAIKRTISLELPPMTSDEISKVLKAIDPVDSGNLVAMFPIKYLDPWSGAYRVGAFYSGDRVTPMYSGVLGLWESLPLEFVEM